MNESDLIIPDKKYKIVERSRSYQLTLPKEIAKAIGVKEGTHIKYVVNKEAGYAIIFKSDRIKGTKINIPGIGIASLKSPISLELFSEIMKTHNK